MRLCIDLAPYEEFGGRSLIARREDSVLVNVLRFAWIRRSGSGWAWRVAPVWRWPCKVGLHQMALDFVADRYACPCGRETLDLEDCR